MNATCQKLTAVLGCISITTTIWGADAKVEEQIVGPTIDPQAGGSQYAYTISPRGAHLATVTHKGSRLNVIVDGMAGPKFDEIMPAAGYIDPRPYQNVNVNLVPQGKSVTFSKNGQRFAYVARTGQDWVLMADNKEMVRLPADTSSSKEFRIEFTGDDGKHLMFSHAVYNGNELWVDGQKWPGVFGSGGGGSAGTIDPVVSPDGSRIAYVAQISREKQAVIVDGQEAGYFGDHVLFTADSKHVVCINHSPKGDALLVDGKALFTARQIIDYYLPPAGGGIIAQLTHQTPGQGTTGYFLLANGKPVEASLSPSVINSVIFSPDGKHYAAICGSAPRQFVVADGKKGQEYETIYANMPGGVPPAFAFSPDSSKVVYKARAGGKEYVVANEDESDGFDFMDFSFSGDGKHLVTSGRTSSGSRLFLDGKPLPSQQASAYDVVFRPDNSHYAYDDKDGTFFDGQPAGLTSRLMSDRYEPVFSPDSQHVAMFAARINDQKYGFYVDGQLVCPFDGSRVPRFCGFTPDSQHVFWFIIEPAVGANAGPGKYESVVYLDGKAVARCEGNTLVSGMLIRDDTRAMGGVTHLGQTPPCWNTGSDGVLTFIGIADNSVKRFTITPSTDTSVATMLAGGKGGATPTPPRTTLEPKSTAPTPTTNPGTYKANQPANPTPPANTATNKLASEINEAADKTKAATDAIKHLFGR